MLYVARNEELVKIGFTDEDDVRTRMRQHAKAGYKGLKLIAVRPGTSLEEGRINKFFKNVPRVRGDEWYVAAASEPIFTWALALLELRFALADPREAARLPDFPYTIWGPEHIKSVLRPIDENGQIHLLEGRLSVRESLSQVTKNGRLAVIQDDWVTAPWVVDRCCRVMGSIDTDPATSTIANEDVVHAKYFYTKDQNGLNRAYPWIGNILLNPPNGRGLNSAQGFTKRLAEEFDKPKAERTVNQAITILNVATTGSLYFLKNIERLASVHCILQGNPGFIPPSGKTEKKHSTRSHILSYFGDNREGFARLFRPHGIIMYSENAIDSDLLGELNHVCPQRGSV